MAHFNKEKALATIKSGDMDDIQAMLDDLEERLNAKKYGLIWEEGGEDEDSAFEPEYVVLDCQRNIPVPKFRSDLSLYPEQSNGNLLLEGDNYVWLKVLQQTYAGKIDIIYIDPPYATGNKDFKYNDAFVDPDDNFKHSKWLDFMSKRLRIAKTLLTADGLIFISIDDRQYAALRLLIDEIFGEDNFINTVSVKTKTSSGASGGGEDKKLKKNIEYLLICANNKDMFELQMPVKATNLMSVIGAKRAAGKSYEYSRVLVDPGQKEHIATTKDGQGNDIEIYARKGAIIKSVAELMKEEKATEEQIYVKYFERIFRTTNAQTSIRTRVNDTVGKTSYPISIEYVPITGRNKGRLTENFYIRGDLFCWLSDTAEKQGNMVLKNEKLGTLWDDLSWTGIAKEGGVDFKNGKKPLAFLKRILAMVDKPQALVLDFFAGSGSTAEAVMQLNLEDGGKRSWILITNNEDQDVDDGDPETGICRDITKPRIDTAITGIKSNGGKYSDGIPSGYQYFQYSFSPRFETREANQRAFFTPTKNIDAVIRLKYGVVLADLDREHMAMLYENKTMQLIVFIKDVDNDVIEEFFDNEHKWHIVLANDVVDDIAGVESDTIHSLISSYEFFM